MSDDVEEQRHQFLSEPWFEAVSILLTEHAPDGSGDDIVMNLVVTETPFAERMELHLGRRAQQLLWGQGHDEQADLTLTVDYYTAQDVFVSGDAQAGIQAFMSGKVVVQGDLTKLMGLMGSRGPSPNPGGERLTEALRAVTA